MAIQRKAVPGHSLLQTAACAAVGLAASRAGAQIATTYTFTGGAQTYTVPATGLYNLTAFGGQGGSCSSMGVSAAGGQGAEAGGFFSLAVGTQLTIYVGGTGGSGQYSAGGGGGSFVYNATTHSLLLVGGGGGGGLLDGGGGARGIGFPGGAGQITPSGNGLGGAAGYYAAGGGGGGYKGNGANSNLGNFRGFGGGGFPTLTGGASTFGVPGAFGGGGGGGLDSAGGGGGYTGGEGYAGDGRYAPSGQGGTSFDAGTMQTLVAGFQSGEGEIVIMPPSGVPEPGSMALVGFAALAAGAGFGRRRRTF